MYSTHQMKLNPEPFGKMLSFSKDIELRLLDDKRQKIKIGDFIYFKNVSNIVLYFFPQLPPNNA